MFENFLKYLFISANNLYLRVKPYKADGRGGAFDMWASLRLIAQFVGLFCKEISRKDLIWLPVFGS